MAGIIDKLPECRGRIKTKGGEIVIKKNEHENASAIQKDKENFLKIALKKGFNYTEIQDFLVENYENLKSIKENLQNLKRKLKILSKKNLPD